MKNLKNEYRREEISSLIPILQKVRKKMIDQKNAYNKFESLMNQIEMSGSISLEEQEKLLQEMKADIEWKIHEVRASQNEW